MKRTGTLLIAVAVVVALAAIPLGATAVFTDDGEGSEDADTNASVAPGEQMAGVIGVQNAEIAGEVSDRAYGLQIANAQTDNARADIVGERLAEIEQRLAEHETELEALQEARDAGEISEGQYRAKVATLAAENANTERAAARTEATAGELPRELLEDRGINVTAIQELRANASELGGPETAEIARSIAGNNVGGDREPGPPAGVGPGNETGPGDRGGGPPAHAGPGNGTDADDGTGDSPDADDTDDRPADVDPDNGTDSTADGGPDNSSAASGR